MPTIKITHKLKETWQRQHDQLVEEVTHRQDGRPLSADEIKERKAEIAGQKALLALPVGQRADIHFVHDAAFHAELNAEPPDPVHQADRASPPMDQSTIAALKSSIAGLMAQHGVTSISFTEPDELVNARAQIRGNEAGYKHTGSYDRGLCGYRVAAVPATSAPFCPVCELLDG